MSKHLKRLVARQKGIDHYGTLAAFTAAEYPHRVTVFEEVYKKSFAWLSDRDFQFYHYTPAIKLTNADPFRTFHLRPKTMVDVYFAGLDDALIYKLTFGGAA